MPNLFTENTPELVAKTFCEKDVIKTTTNSSYTCFNQQDYT